MSHSRTRATASYKEAVAATEDIQPPAVGFAKPSDNVGAQSSSSVIIKQNNTIIQLLASLSEKVNTLETEVRHIKNVFDSREPSTSTLPTDLIEKLEGLTLTDKQERPKERKGTLFAFKDPYVILQEEKEKLKKAT
ncbi:hypothetical protein [Hibiscus bacilliform virus GD1]|uniref:hypothetical protein n=1 Tax=Hibiscus bacilliform virus GD1 TaxID=1459800 RepID=UPI0003EFCE56|nr:hypothetical protein [Hibiscus bacilliform virus GD1]AHI90953.1 hypothetical protein [Hibiscus bacilliform virus GD1]